MARRYAGRGNVRKRPIAPQDIPDPIDKKERKWRFDIIIIGVIVIIALLIFEPMFNTNENELQEASNPKGVVVAVDYPIITEVMSSNRDALAASDGNYYDWVEIYNPTPNK